jgi:hypothetical protein
MRKAINTAALIFFIWLVLDAFNIPTLLLGFLLVGAIPGNSISLSPTVMLAIQMTLIVIFVFEMMARRIDTLHRLRHHILGLAFRKEHIPRHRLSRT